MKAIKEIIGLLTDIRDELRKFNAPAPPKMEPKQEPAKAVKVTPDPELMNYLFQSPRKKYYGTRSSHARWTEEEDAFVLDGLKKGWDYGRIARGLFGRSERSIIDRVKILRLKYKTQ